MRFHAKGALFFFLLCLMTIPAALAQEKRASNDGAHRVTANDPDRQPKPRASRLLNVSEGLAILGAALDSRHHAAFKSDCSHFVHGLYERAGFPYEYASSSDLYAGADEFRRVASPQPGDLAVWRGHAGIVVNPVQHSFFSLLRSGPGVELYNSPYWKRRGPPRFFRYVKAVPSGVVASSIRTATLKPTALDNAEPREPAAEDPAPDVWEESSSATKSSTKLTESQPTSTTTSRVPVVNSIHPKPDQVSAAFLQACTDSEAGLRGHDLFKPSQSLIVFDHFTVKKVHISGSQDWVDVQIDELVSLTGGKAEVHKRLERQRWLLSRRDNSSWELTPSRDTIYLPQPIAVRVLAHDLAQLTEDSPDTTSQTREKAELARLLDALLQK
jgi:hypothetical protein